MRVLQANKFLHRKGGAEAHMLDVADLLRDLGHDVAFFGMRDERNVPNPLADLEPSFVDLGSPGEAGVLDRARTAARMVWSRECAAAMSAALARWRPDVVHAHNVYHQLSPSILRACARAGVPVVMTVHDYKLVCPSYQLMDDGRVCEACVGSHVGHAVARRCQGGSLGQSALLALESGLHRRFGAYDDVARFLSPSHFLARKLVEGGFDEQRVQVLNNFVPVAPARDRDAGDLLLFAGRLSFEKGVDTLLDALARVPDARLVVAGDGPARAELEALAGAVGDRVRFLGHVSKAEVVDLLGRARAMVVPSRWHENQPLSVLEAFEASVPVVATSLGGLPELVRGGETGWVVPPDDPAALATALAHAWDDDDAVRSRGRAGRARVERDHAPDVFRERLLAVYDAVVARSVTVPSR